MYKIRVIFKTVVMGNMMCTRGPKPDIDEQQDTLTTQNFGARAGDKRNTLNGNYALKVGIDGNAQVRDTLKADIAGKQNIMQRNNNGTGADDTLNIIPVNGKGTVKTYEDGKLELRDTSVEGILQVEPKSKLIFQGNIVSYSAN